MELARTYSRLGLVEDELFAALSADERAVLHRLLERVVGAVTVESPGCAPDRACTAGPPLPGESAQSPESAC